MSVVYRDELNEYYDLNDEQRAKAYNKFVVENRVDVENLMDENYLFDTKGNCHDEKEIWKF